MNRENWTTRFRSVNVMSRFQTKSKILPLEGCCCIVGTFIRIHSKDVDNIIEFDLDLD